MSPSPLRPIRNLGRAVWLVLTLRCDEADELACAIAGQRASTAQRAAHRVHTALCKSCRAAQRELELIDRGLRTLAHDPEGGSESAPGNLTGSTHSAARLSPEARARLERALRERAP